jgi:hypothetical protein
MSAAPHGHVSHLDPTDIPPVSAGAMQAVINLIVERGQALVLLDGAPAGARGEIERAFWQTHSGDWISGNAALIRFWHLVDAMGARRLKALFLERGYAALAPLAACAAVSRLNVQWGFKSQHLVAALLANATALPGRSSDRIAA